MKEKTQEIPIDGDYSMRKQTPAEKEHWNDAEIGEYSIKIDLSVEQQDELKKNAFCEFEQLVDERKSLKLEDKWGNLELQYAGQLAPIKNIEFAIDVRESKIKVDSLVRACKEATFPDDGDIIDVSPRPEMARQDGWEIANKQQQFISYAMSEEIKPELAFTKAWQSTFKKYVGIVKVCWSYHQETRRREEHWEGKLEQVAIAPDGTPIFDNEGLRRFLQAYPDAVKRYPGQVKALASGKSIDIVVWYKEQVRNNPQFKYVKLEDFYVRNACEYNDGLQTEHLIAERQQYSYFELMKMQDDGEFVNVDQLWSSNEADGKPTGDYKTKLYDVLEFTTYFKLKDSDKSETKVKCWFGEEKKIFLGTNQYPFYSIDADYIGFWATTNDKGFYGDAESVMYDLKDTHIAQDALISLILHSIYIRNVITPIVRSGSEIEQAFTDKTFRTGDPLIVDDMTDDVNKGMGFVQWPATDTNGGLAMLEKIKRIGSDVSRVSDLTTGGESELDPNAPASKTIALLQQSGIGVKDYIKMLLPNINLAFSYIPQLYYQMSTDDRKYRIQAKSKQVTGKDVFGDIKRDELVLRTNIQSRAASFAFDKVMEKREGMAAYQMLMENPYAMRQPAVLYKALKTIMSTFGGRWRTIGEVDLLSPEQFDMQQKQIAMQAVMQLFQMAQQNAQVTGVAPNPEELMNEAPEAITRAQAEAFNPSLKEIQT